MNGLALWNFIIIFFELIICGAIIFAGLEFIVTDERFKRIAKLAVGGVLVLKLLFALGGVLGMGGGGGAVSPIEILFFAIGVIVVLVLWYIIVAALDWAPTVFPPIAPYKEGIKFVLSAFLLIVVLLLAADLLFNAGIIYHGHPLLAR